jgi:hypothetical protein
MLGIENVKKKKEVRNKFKTGETVLLPERGMSMSMQSLQGHSVWCMCT